MIGRFAGSATWLAKHRLASLVLLGAVLCVCAVTMAEPTGQAATSTPTAGLQGLQRPADYGWWVLAPPVVAIVLAVLTRQVVVALFVGTLLLAGCATSTPAETKRPTPARK